MIPRDEQPHFRAVCRDGSHWVLGIESRDSFLAAYMGGKAFWQGRCAWDAPVVIKLADITGTSEWTESRLAQAEAEREIRKSRELTEG